MGIVSEGPVASVALFSAKPTRARFGSIAVDTSSRTSSGLLRVLCRETFGIEPEFVPMPPAIDRCWRDATRRWSSAIPRSTSIIGRAGLAKIDLGEQWTALTGLPFVWAFWAGRPGVLSPGALAALSDARDAGVAASDAIADAYCGPERAALGRAVFERQYPVRARRPRRRPGCGGTTSWRRGTA